MQVMWQSGNGYRDISALSDIEVQAKEKRVQVKEKSGPNCNN